uniref:AAA+ ATPase domain-containing protein n=2 Tax=Nelumbo nucifera TaxID=4432 RepID=A0A822ZFT0_NELNU|nr:TPA_asm: hypothetical protein HUJ06_001967 [Nelumbo nucifera]
MAMEFISSIVLEIGKCLLGPVFEAVGQRVNYVVKVKENIEQLSKQVRELEKTKESVENLIKQVERKGEDIKDSVTKWLEDVKSIVDETNSFINNEIKENGSCFKGLYPNCGSRYQLSKKAGEKMKRIKELQEGGRFDVVSDPAPPLGIEFMCDRDFQMFKSRELAIKEIREALRDENVHVIGVYGMGGVGKTTLVKEIGKQVEKEKLFDKVVMAVVSQDRNLKQIQGEIAGMLPLEFEEKEDVLERAQKLSRKLQNEKSILIILDDMWDYLDLKQLGIPLDLDDNNQRERRGCCKILLTTRSQDVCHEMKTNLVVLKTYKTKMFSFLPFGSFSLKNPIPNS